MWQSKESHQELEQSGVGGSPVTQLEGELESEGEEKTLKASQLQPQVATAVAAGLVEMQNWKPEEKTPTQLDPAGRNQGAGSQGGGLW